MCQTLITSLCEKICKQTLKNGEKNNRNIEHTIMLLRNAHYTMIRIATNISLFQKHKVL